MWVYNRDVLKETYFMAGEVLTQVPPSEEVRKYEAMQRAKKHSAGLMERAKAQVQQQKEDTQGQSMKENAADLGVWATKRITLPVGIGAATVVAFINPVAAGLILGGSFYDYAGMKYTEDQKEVWKRERIAREGTVFEAKKQPTKREVALAA